MFGCEREVTAQKNIKSNGLLREVCHKNLSLQERRPHNGVIVKHKFFCTFAMSDFVEIKGIKFETCKQQLTSFAR